MPFDCIFQVFGASGQHELPVETADSLSIETAVSRDGDADGISTRHFPATLKGISHLIQCSLLPPPPSPRPSSSLEYFGEQPHVMKENRLTTAAKRHTTPGIRRSSPTQLLLWPSLACLWESRRDPEFSSRYGRMWMFTAIQRPYMVSG
ncbi:hypothetical protein B0T25DRAFT_41651 [Lasiosphaeria hispida]|uniref:Uncharacterized protein n=1 Tax=Lasiosphaeria hispida TaxID=260671 RepID=A0AAJ0HV92_9PEZI|nr:hypothetical protein B0T25DRAFT_41651 [Lasiosphaeria hispida]